MKRINERNQLTANAMRIFHGLFVDLVHGIQPKITIERNRLTADAMRNLHGLFVDLVHGIYYGQIYRT